MAFAALSERCWTMTEQTDRVAGMRSLFRVAVLGVLGASAMLAQAGLKRPAITGIAFVRFAESDPAAAAKFYHNDLGFDEVQGAGPNGIKVTRYPVNDQQWVETVAAPKDGKARLQAVGFTTRDVRGMQRYLEAKGFQAIAPVSEGEFAIHDPEGNTIVFVQTGSQADVAHAKASPRASSHRMIHAGFVVQSAAAEDKLFVDALGFKPYWHGGMKDGVTDFVSQQVPEGTDWLEYMLNVKPDAGARQLGVSDHFSLGTSTLR